jgi:uncharacterized membrane protein
MKQIPILMGGIGLLLCSCQNSKPSTSRLEEKSPAQAGVFEFSCRGTEPFWLVEIYPDSIIYQRAGGPKVLYPYASPQIKGDSTHYETKIKLHNKLSVMHIKLVADSCSDGMSDQLYPYTAIIERDGELLQGCAITELPQ